MQLVGHQRQSVGPRRQSAAHLGRALAFRVLRARLDDESGHHEDLLEPKLFHRMGEAGDVQRRRGGRPDLECGCGGRACNLSVLVLIWNGRACNLSVLSRQAHLGFVILIRHLRQLRLPGFVIEDSDGEVVGEHGGIDGGGHENDADGGATAHEIAQDDEQKIALQ